MYCGLMRGRMHGELSGRNHLQRRAMFVWHGPQRTRMRRIGDLLRRDMHTHRHGRELRRMRTHLRWLGRVLQRHVSQHER